MGIFCKFDKFVDKFDKFVNGTFCMCYNYVLIHDIGS